MDTFTQRVTTTDHDKIGNLIHELNECFNLKPSFSTKAWDIISTAIRETRELGYAEGRASIIGGG